MSRGARARPAPQPAAPAVTGAGPCPCGLGAAYDACCGRFHQGTANAPTAELLMRSRYAAFAARDEAYLLRTWHVSTRPEQLGFNAGQRWTRLEIVSAAGGSAFHTEGTVRFRAYYTERGRAGVQEEESRFERDSEGRWVYLDGEQTPQGLPGNAR